MEEIVMNNQAQTIASIMNQINKDGRISKEDVDKLREYLQGQDGTLNITRDGAEELFKWKKLLHKNDKIDDGFYVLFIDAICAYLLEDGTTNGVLDEREIEWLREKILKEPEIDSVIVLLLEKLRDVSINYPAEFDAFIVRHCFSDMLHEALKDGKEVANFDANIDKLTALFNEGHSKLIVDRESVGILFLIKDKIFKTGVDNPKFTELFINYVSMALLTDAESPGKIDETEAEWLEKEITSKSVVDDVDKVLLEQLKKKSVNFPELLARILFEKRSKSIRAKVAENGNISHDDVLKLKEYLAEQYDDYPLAEKKKADLMFDLKRMTLTDKKKRNKSFEGTFVESVCNYLLSPRSKSPGEIGPKDEEWLDEQLGKSEGRYDALDEALLEELNEQSLNFPKRLDLRLSKIKLMRILCRMKEKREKEEPVSIIDYIVDIQTALYGANHELRIDDKKEIAEYLFQIKDLIYVENTKKEKLIKRIRWKKKPQYCKDFSKLFVDVVSSFLLQDKDSLGSIDDQEAMWLLARMKYKGGLDDYDVDLLKQLRNKSINYPELLVNKKQLSKSWEQLIFKCRKLSIIAVIASILAFITLLIKGIAHIVYALSLTFDKPCESCECLKSFIGWLKRFINITVDDQSTFFVQVIESVDTFLVALVFLIFAIGIYELFIGKFDPVIRINDKRPSWMRISSIDDLKSSLVKVLLIAMIVGFYKMTLKGGNYQELMFLAIGIVLISAAFCIAEISAHYHKKNKEEK